MLDWRGYCAKNLKNPKNCPDGIRFIVANWGELSCLEYVCLAAFVCKAVGIVIGQIFIELYHWNNLFLINLTVIGHSLGGRIVSIACQFVRDTLPADLPNRIVGRLVRKLEKLSFELKFPRISSFNRMKLQFQNWPVHCSKIMAVRCPHNSLMEVIRSVLL